MTRSSSKGPYVDPRVLKKIEGKKPIETGVIKTWSRACVIAPEMVGFNFGVHNGKTHIEVLVTEEPSISCENTNLIATPVGNDCDPACGVLEITEGGVVLVLLTEPV